MTAAATTGINRNRLIKLLGLTGSEHDGEALSAMRKANALMRDANVDWNDLLQPFDQLQVAIAAAEVLFAENEALRAAASQPGAAPIESNDWEFVSAGTGTPPEQARWALAMHNAQRVSLSDFEYDFLLTISECELSARQKPIFERLIAKLSERTREHPP